jgi:NTP pyrophosphatase (non-canonical NTP hydrolase)
MAESQHSISEWAEETFGPSGSDVRVAARANEEMAELLRACCMDDVSAEKKREEIADVVIVLCRLMTRLGGDLNKEIDRKMAVNRQRIWRRDGSGHGYHHVEGRS